MKKIRAFQLLFVLTFLQFLVAGIFTLQIPADPKNAFWFGYSLQRVILFLLCLLLSGLSLIAFRLTSHRNTFTEKLERIKTIWSASPWVKIGLLSIAVLGWTIFFASDDIFGKWVYYVQRVRPIASAAGLTSLEIGLFLYRSQPVELDLSLRTIRQSYGRPMWISAIVLFSIALWMGITKIGLVQSLPLWNVPGIPIAGLQYLSVVLMIGCSLLLAKHSLPGIKNSYAISIIVLPILIYLSALLLWGQTPMLKHFFSLEPIPPQNQPYPYSDARIHDVGAISVLQGKGIYFHNYTDKPLYMVFLAIFHALAGFDYRLLTWLQIAVLAIIPVIAYFLGKEVYGSIFGVALAFIFIYRERNAIVLAHKISSVNPKLFITEVFTLLGLLLAIYLAFLWLRSRRSWLGLLTGGVIGATSLIRMNPLLVFPVVALLAGIILRRTPRILVKHLILYVLGFSILVAPWIISGVSPDGRSWMIIKFFDVINTRYQKPNALAPGAPPVWGSLAPLTFAGGRLNAAQASVEQDVSGLSEISPQSNFSKILNHSLHNLSSAVLALPDSLKYENLDQLAGRPYWQDTVDWDGNFSPRQGIFILFNLLLISVGLGYSWRKSRWAGLIPLAILLTYAVSLGMAMTSGGRYIVPIDWIVFYYYILGVILALKFLTGLITGGLSPSPQEPAAPIQRPERRSVILSLLGLLVVASAIPIANNIIPMLVPVSPEKDALKQAVRMVQTEPSANERYIAGQVFYPYVRSDGTLNFLMVTEEMRDEFYIPVKDKALRDMIKDDDTLILRLQWDNKKKVHVRSIHLFEDNLPRLVWAQR